MKIYTKTIVSLCLALWASALSAQTHFSFNLHEFKYDMTVYFSLQNGDVMVSDPGNYEVAAFVGDECRGVATFENQIGQNGVAVKYWYMKVYSNQESGETIVFKCYDKDAAKERTFTGVSVPFAENGLVGYPSSPQKLILEYTINAQSAFAGYGTVDGGGLWKSGSSITLTANPIEGYKFVGWSNGVTGNPYTFVVDKDLTLTADFAPQEYTMTFVLDNGEENVVKKQNYKTSLTAPVPTKKGFTFAGWDATVPASVPVGDKTFTAQWTRNSYQLKFISDESTVKEETVDYEAEVIKPADPQKIGYTFTGWSPDMVMTMPDHDLTYTAQFSVNQYKVTFISDGNIVKSENLEYGSDITMPTNPEVEGLEFLGWAPDVLETMPAQDVTYTAKFKRSQYYATFIVDDEVKQKSEVASEATISKPANPTKEGYSFTGWQPEVPSTMPNHDMAFTAKFEINKYQVKWIVDGMTHTDNVNYHSSIIKPADPTKEGYTFTGWSTGVPELMPANDLEFTAQFSLNQYTVKFVVDGEENESSLDYGSIIQAETPTKEGYTFTGWSPELKEGATVPARDITYTAQFSVNKYKVTFKADPDTLSTIKQDFGSEIVTPSAPSKTGFTFKGWSPAVPETVLAQDMVFEADYERNSYLSVFISEGDTLRSDVVLYEDAVSQPEDPTKTGHTFAGWSPLVLERMPANDVTYFAQFAINQYSMTFVFDNGQENLVKTQDYGTALTAPDDPVKPGFTFAGWSTPVPATIPAADSTFTAQWMRNKYLVTFVADGQTVKTDSVFYEGDITKPADPVKEGYTFTGWSPAIPETMPAEDQTFTAQFSINQYTMTFVLDNGQENVVKIQDYGTALTAPDDPVKTGFTFAGWSTPVPATIPAADSTFTAQWTRNKYQVTFVADGQTVKTDSVLYEGDITKPADPVKEGYTFTGWSPAIPETMPAEDQTFTAQFSINQYTMTFVLDNGQENVVKIQDYGTALTAPDDPVKTGFTFAGWSTPVPATIPAADSTFTAQWTRNKYQVTFVADGQTVKTDSVLYEGAITKPADPVKEGYTFTGWSPAIPEKMPAEDQTFTAQFSINQYTMTFVFDNGQENVVKTQDYGTALTAPDDPVKTGFTFAGWSTPVPATIPAADSTFTAQWTRNKYLVTFLADGQTVKTDSVLYEGAITKPADPVKEGYTFTGWSPAIPEKMPAEDQTFTAQFSINQYTIVFDSDGGTAVDSIKADYQSVLSKPADPTKEGYTFAGWTPEFPETMPLDGATLKATWTPITYTISYDLAGGALSEGDENPSTYTIESDEITLKNPTRDGYEFTGWTGTNLTEATMTVTIAKGSIGNLEYTATWKVISGIHTIFIENKTVSVYTVKGILVGHKMTVDEVLKLKHGVYIINGKKIAIK